MVFVSGSDIQSSIDVSLAVKVFSILLSFLEFFEPTLRMHEKDIYLFFLRLSFLLLRPSIVFKSFDVYYLLYFVFQYQIPFKRLHSLGLLRF